MSFARSEWLTGWLLFEDGLWCRLHKTRGWVAGPYIPNFRHDRGEI